MHIICQIHLSQEQKCATTLYEDNQGVLLMANAQQPAKRTRHMDLKYFALQVWCDRDLIMLKHISTSNNWSDAMTKSMPCTLFYRHMAMILGKIIPQYVDTDSRNELKQILYEDISVGNQKHTNQEMSPTSLSTDLTNLPSLDHGRVL